MNAVGDILTALKNSVETVLGSDYEELNYSYQLELNDRLKKKYGFGVGVRGGDSVEGVVKNVTIDQVFFVALLGKFVNKTKDKSQREVITEMYEKIQAINVEVMQKKLGIQDVVLVVQDVSLTEPELIDKGAIALVIDYTIKYRAQTV